jgi:hypothetical protein
MSAELDVPYIKSVVQEILNRSHNSAEKRQMLVKQDCIVMACPICGDSMKNLRKKRGKLWFKNMFYVCWNEGCRSTFTNLCNSNHIQLDITKKAELMTYLSQQIRYTKDTDDGFVLTSLDKLIPIEDLENYFNSGQDEILSDFRPVRAGDKVYNYLVNERRIPQQIVLDEFYCAKRSITKKWKQDVVVFLNRTPDRSKVLGMQLRSIDATSRLFKVYPFHEIYAKVYPDKPLDEMEGLAYDKISYLFNILRINYEDTITIFEGYLDSLFYNNSVGAVGADTDFNFLFDNGLDIQFFFDNDPTGMDKSNKMLKLGYPVFLWKKMVDDLSRSRGDYYTNVKKLGIVKDLNKLAQMVLDPVKNMNLPKYFAKNEFDRVWLDKKSKKEKRNRTLQNVKSWSDFDATSLKALIT